VRLIPTSHEVGYNMPSLRDLEPGRRDFRWLLLWCYFQRRAYFDLQYPSGSFDFPRFARKNLNGPETKKR
jgi:hypothetical protein